MVTRYCDSTRHGSMACSSNVSLLVLLLSLSTISFSRAADTTFCGAIDYDHSDCKCYDHFDHDSNNSPVGGMLRCSNDNPIISSQRTHGAASTHAVIHMGIHNTGTDIIQALSQKFAAELQQDGYDMPWKVYQDRWPALAAKLVTLNENQVEFSACFLPSENPERLAHPCIPELLMSGLDIVKIKNNIFVSSQSFSSISLDGLDSLSAYLSRWDIVTIIIYYRRYYDWLLSDYNAQIAQRQLKDSNMWKMSIVDFVTKQTSETDLRYTSSLVERVIEHFDNVVLMNFHEKTKDLSEAFYCDAMPNAHHTCTAVRKQKKIEKDNGSVELIYQELAYGARQKGLMKINSQGDLNRVATSSKHYHEQEMKLTTRDFKMKCLSPETKESLLKISLESEQELFPERFDSPLGEADLRSDFDSKSQYELCELDIEETLKEEKWEYFFKIRGAAMVWNKPNDTHRVLRKRK